MFKTPLVPQACPETGADPRAPFCELWTRVSRGTSEVKKRLRLSGRLIFQVKELQDPCLGREWGGGSLRWAKPTSEVPLFSHLWVSFLRPVKRAGGRSAKSAVASRRRALAVQLVTCPQQPRLAGPGRQRAPRVSFAISAQLPRQLSGLPREKPLAGAGLGALQCAKGSFWLSPDANPFLFSLGRHTAGRWARPAFTSRLWPKPKATTLALW